MLESPDYFFRVREIGRLRQTRSAVGGLRMRTRKTARRGQYIKLPKCQTQTLWDFTMTPRPRVVTPLLFAVGLCALVNCGEQLRRGWLGRQLGFLFMYEEYRFLC